MLTANCGYQDAPQGPTLLVHFGPRIWVNIGFDPTYNPHQNAPPKAGISNVEALVDTGAQESCIDDLLAAELNLQVIDRRMVVGVGAGGALEVNVHLAQIHIPVLKFTEYGAFAAVPLIASGFRHKAVIGRTFLRHMRMSYDGKSGSVEISRDD
jgi:predicted aspartyl protease